VCQSEWMYIGVAIFAVLAVLCVVAFIKVKKRDDAYGRGEDL
jgi:hypothetical protein